MFFFEKIRAQAETSPLGNYWLRLLPRERLALLMLFSATLLITIKVLVWLPMTHYVNEASDYFDQQRSLNRYLNQHAHRIHRSAENLPDQPSQEQLQGAVTSISQRLGLQIGRLDRDDETLLVVMTKTEFNKLIMWLGELQEAGGKLLEIGVVRVSNGQVEARVRLSSST